jgi:hypothetical protein
VGPSEDSRRRATRPIVTGSGGTGPSGPVPFAELHYGDVVGLEALGALLDLELDPRALIEAAVAVGLDGGKVHKHILSAIPLDEPKTLGGIEPLDSTLFLHGKTFLFLTVKLFELLNFHDEHYLRAGLEREGKRIKRPLTISHSRYFCNPMA